jgi:hypothetical protein
VGRLLLLKDFQQRIGEPKHNGGIHPFRVDPRILCECKVRPINKRVCIKKEEFGFAGGHAAKIGITLFRGSAISTIALYSQDQNLPMTNPLEYFLHWEKLFPNDIVFRQAKGDHWITWTYQQAGDEIRRMAGYLESMALPPHSHIAILSKNCPHWIMADLAIIMSGHVSVPLYPTLSLANWTLTNHKSMASPTSTGLVWRLMAYRRFRHGRRS